MKKSDMKVDEFVAMLVGFVIGVGIVLMVALLALAAQASTHTPNQPGYWCEDGTKIDEYTGGDTWEADGNYDLVILKHGTSNTVFESVSSGMLLVTPDGKDISHIIVCPPTETTTTTVGETTTTTVQETTTTSPSTTSTTVPETTTTTDTSSTTVTTVPPTTTTTVGARPSELPFTGSHEGLVFLGALALVAGVGILAFGRE